MRLPDARSVILILVASIPTLAAAAAAPSEEPPWGFDALLGFDALPLLADRPAFQDSSYSRQDVRSYNWSGAWAFCIRPADPDHKLKFARKPE